MTSSVNFPVILFPKHLDIAGCRAKGVDEEGMHKGGCVVQTLPPLRGGDSARAVRKETQRGCLLYTSDAADE